VAHFLGQQRPDRPGCIILNIRLPDMDGLDLHGRPVELGIGLPAVVMTGHGDIPMSARAMKAGAVDFLAKPFRDSAMLAAVATALARDLARRTAADGASNLKSRHVTLSPRER
jgi:FixJ family two-component response regulator